MKRSIFFSIAAVIAFLFFSTNINAQNQGKGNGTPGSGNPDAPKVNWVDANGDGICDNFGTTNQGSGKGKGYGKKDGTGNHVRPQDGTGYGKKGGNGTGICDGTGSKGRGNRGGNK
ncbi:MAG: hypothetical protein V1720_21785 [bacterium]